MSTKTFKIAKEATFSDKLSDLNDKIDSVKKQITYLDVYNISDAVTDKNTFNAKVNALMNNSSLVINTTPFFVNNKLYKTGDIILKNNYGDIVHIKSQSGGIFYPSSITKDNDSNNYAIKYEFSESSPSKEIETVEVNTTATLAKQITFTNLTSIDNNGNYVYGIWDQVIANPYYFSIFMNNSRPVQPYIKFFISSDNTNGNLAEEIALNYKIEQDGNLWKITIDSNRFITQGELWIKVK